MITINDAILLPLTEAEIKTVMQKALAQFDIAKRDNLRHRHLNIKYDCILRGYIGEYAISKWLTENGITLTATNYVTDGDAMDIDFLYKQKNIELKTSLLPDVDVNVKTAIAKRDIKLIQRKKIIEDLKGDIHLQILYNQRRKAKDEWLEIQQIDFANILINDLYDVILAKAYKNTCYFVGWIDKETLIKKINALPLDKHTWYFKNSMRLFWNCKIRESNAPISLLHFLKAM